MTYFVLFFVFLCTSFIFHFNHNKYFVNFIYIVLVSFLIFFVGFRFESVDYYAYMDVWNKVSFNYLGFPFYSSGGGTTGNEFLFATLISLFKENGLSFVLFLFFIAFLSVGIKAYYFKKYSPYIFLSLVVYLSTLFFKDMGQIRNALAASIFLFGIKPLVERNIFKFSVVSLVAFGIQSFAFIGFFVYFFYPVVNKRYAPYILLIISFFISLMGGLANKVLFLASYFPESMFVRANSYFNASEPLYYHALNISFFAFSFLFLNYRKLICNKNIYLNGLISYFVFSVMLYFAFFDFPVVAGRILELLSYSALSILLPAMIYTFHGYKRHVLFIISILYCSLLFYSTSLVAEPYQSYFLHGKIM